MNKRNVGKLSIGITQSTEVPPVNYIAAIERMSGSAVLLKNDALSIERDLSLLAGVLVTGGFDDIAPSIYGHKKHTATIGCDPLRDSYEIALVLAATAQSIPLLMICRGLQIANVAFGGTLHQHIPDIVDGQVLHMDLERKFQTFKEHTIIVKPGSLLAEITGSARFATNATHHQAVNAIGHGLIATAHTDDGIIECLEMPGASAFWLATQWHPERLLDSDGGQSVRIFERFMDACLAPRPNDEQRGPQYCRFPPCHPPELLKRQF